MTTRGSLNGVVRRGSPALVASTRGQAVLLAVGVSLAAGLPALFPHDLDSPDPTAKAGTLRDACDHVTAVHGHDGNPGTAEQPYRTVRRLARALRPGEVGCLRRGIYRENVTLRRAGLARRRIVLRSWLGERATLLGRLVVAERADYVTVQNLELDGSKAPGRLPSPTVNGDFTVFEGNDVTNRHRAICFVLGNRPYGAAHGTVVRGNRVHDCGSLPPSNHDHGIYVAIARNTLIEGNWIYDNADRGVQLYPDARRTRVVRNVIDGNGVGVIISGDGGKASSGNLIERNALTNSNQRNNVESYWPSGNPIGRDNVVRRNCIHGGARDDGDGGIAEYTGGFRVEDNLLADPLYLNRPGKDFRLGPESPCLALLGNIPPPGIRPKAADTLRRP
jgi:hypothetical protein